MRVLYQSCWWERDYSKNVHLYQKISENLYLDPILCFVFVCCLYNRTFRAENYSNKWLRKTAFSRQVSSLLYLCHICVKFNVIWVMISSVSLCGIILLLFLVERFASDQLHHVKSKSLLYFLFEFPLDTSSDFHLELYGMSFFQKDGRLTTNQLMQQSGRSEKGSSSH